LFGFGLGASGGMFGGQLTTDNTNAKVISGEGNNTAICFKINVADGLWHNITYVVPNIPNPKFADIKIYVDGTNLVVQGDPINTGFAVNTVLGSNTFIGSQEYGTGLFFNGLLDDFRIYNRELSETEIKLLSDERP
ncbi:MAG TPA: LamG-like jellyroll fold domain-containing protein, partial [Puia sp.]